MKENKGRGGLVMEFEEKIDDIKTIHEGVVTTYQLADVTLPDGKKAKREIVRHKPASAVIAFTDDNKLLLVRQYRVAIGKTTLELPAGLHEEEDKDGVVTAKRELEEETGMRAQNWRFVTSFYSTPGFTDEFLEIYEAYGLEKIKNPRAQDEDEFIEVVALDFEEAMDAYSNGELCDSKTVFALFYWNTRRLKAENKNA